MVYQVEAHLLAYVFRELLQIYIWQDYDVAPDFPILRKFLDFWAHNLDGPLAEVRVAQKGFIAPAKFKLVNHELILH